MLLALLLAASCSGDCRAQQQFQEVERKLLSGLLQLEVKTKATGPLAADATTDLSVGPATRLRTRGTLAGKPLEKSLAVPTTPDLRDAVVLGMLRLGLLPNLTRLAEGEPLDYAGGGARDSLKAVKFRRVKGGVRFAVQRDGKDAGEATLLIDAKTKLPAKRTGTLRVEGGTVKLEETYRFPR